MYYLILIIFLITIRDYLSFLIFFNYLLLIKIPPKYARNQYAKIKNIYYNLILATSFLFLTFYSNKYFLILALFFVNYQDFKKLKINLKNNNWEKITKEYKENEYVKEYIDFLLNKNNFKELRLLEKKMNYKQKELYYNKTGQFDKVNKIDFSKLKIYSNNPKNYIIRKEDYLRNNIVDNDFYDEYKHLIFKYFKEKCVSCGTRDNLELDHFIIPKSMGGNFILYHKKGIRVINAIPLCRSCNAKKSNRLDYFSKESIYKIQLKLSKIQRLINDRKYNI